MGAVGLRGGDDRLVNGPELALWSPGELGRAGGERTAYAAPVEIGPFFGAAGPAGRQWGRPAQPAQNRAPGPAVTRGAARPRKPHRSPAATGQPGSRARTPGLRASAHAGRALLAAMGTAAGPPRRAGHADGPADGHEVAGPVPPAHRAGGHRAVEAAAAELALAVMGAPGDARTRPQRLAAPFRPRGTDRAQRSPAGPRP